MIPYLRLQSDNFNKSKILSNFINDCCFGEDVANFLVEKFQTIGYAIKGRYQEDWGWQIELAKDKIAYLVSIGLPCDIDDNRNVKCEKEEFMIHIEKKRNLLQVTLGKQKKPDMSLYHDFNKLLKADKKIKSFQWVIEEKPGQEEEIIGFPYDSTH